MNTNQENHINYFGSEINSEMNLASQQLQQESRQNSIGFDNSDEDDDDEDDEDDADFDEDEDEEISRRSKAAQKKRLAQRRPKKANSQSDGEDMISNLDDDGNGEDESNIPNKELIYPPSNSYHMSEKIILLKISERDLLSGSLPPNGVVQFTFTQLKCLIEAMLQINNLRKGKI